MQRVEQRRSAIAGRNRQSSSLGEFVDLTPRSLGPAAAAEREQWIPGFAQKFAELGHFLVTGRGLDRLVGRRIGDIDPFAQHVLRQRHDHWSKPAAASGVERARDELSDAVGVVDLDGPFRHAAEDRAIIEFLECFALAH